jgi:hypothetical protein
MTHQDNCLIARNCGWVLRQEECGLWSAYRIVHGSTEIKNLRHGVSEEHAQAACLPRYFSDLNACHDAESFLTGRELVFYLSEIAALMNEDGSIGWRLTTTVRAPAKIRAAALAKIFGKRKANP